MPYDRANFGTDNDFGIKEGEALVNKDYDVGTANTSYAASLTAAEFGDGVHHKTRLTLSGVTVTMTRGGTSCAYGNLDLYTFPNGELSLLGGNLALVTSGGPTLGQTATVEVSLGSTTNVPTNQTNITNAMDENIVLGQSATVTLAACVGTFSGANVNTSSTNVQLATTQHTAELKIVGNTSWDAAATVSVSGTMTFNWMNLSVV